MTWLFSILKSPIFNKKNRLRATLSSVAVSHHMWLLKFLQMKENVLIKSFKTRIKLKFASLVTVSTFQMLNRTWG